MLPLKPGTRVSLPHLARAGGSAREILSLSHGIRGGGWCHGSVLGGGAWQTTSKGHSYHTTPPHIACPTLPYQQTGACLQSSHLHLCIRVDMWLHYCCMFVYDFMFLICKMCIENVY